MNDNKKRAASCENRPDERRSGHKDFQSFALPTELWHHHYLQYFWSLYACFLNCDAKVVLLFYSSKLFKKKTFIFTSFNR